MTVSNAKHVGRGGGRGRGRGRGWDRWSVYSGADSNERGEKKKKKLMVKGFTEGEANTSSDLL